MKRLLIAGLGLACAAAMTVNARAADHKNLTDEQKTVLQEMLSKYDTNKDGKLEKDERANMTKEDKKKWAKTFGHHKKTPTTTTTPNNAGTPGGTADTPPAKQ
jgi:hypothetical protein